MCLSNSLWQVFLTGQSALRVTDRSYHYLYCSCSWKIIKGQPITGSPCLLSQHWTLFSSCCCWPADMTLRLACPFKIRPFSSLPSQPIGCWLWCFKNASACPLKRPPQGKGGVWIIDEEGEGPLEEEWRAACVCERARERRRHWNSHLAEHNQMLQGDVNQK